MDLKDVQQSREEAENDDSNAPATNIIHTLHPYFIVQNARNQCHNEDDEIDCSKENHFAILPLQTDLIRAIWSFNTIQKLELVDHIVLYADKSRPLSPSSYRAFPSTRCPRHPRSFACHSPMLTQFVSFAGTLCVSFLNHFSRLL